MQLCHRLASLGKLVAARTFGVVVEENGCAHAAILKVSRPDHAISFLPCLSSVTLFPHHPLFHRVDQLLFACQKRNKEISHARLYFQSREADKHLTNHTHKPRYSLSVAALMRFRSATPVVSAMAFHFDFDSFLVFTALSIVDL